MRAPISDWPSRPGWLIAVALTAALLGWLPGVAAAASWKLVPAPLPSGSPDGVIDSVSCIASDACTAVGFYDSGGGAGFVELPLVERWDGTRFSPQSTPSFSHGQVNGLDGVSCVSASWCMAVGSYETGSGSIATLTELDAGDGWEIVPSPSPQVEAALGTLSCSSTRACIAVGYQIPPGSTGMFPLAERWNGSSWSLMSVPVPAGASSAAFGGVSCTSGSACTAVGERNLDSNSLVERWNGSKWSIQSAPIPHGYNSDAFFDVSCVSATACTVAGLAGPSGTQQVITERWNGSAWSPMANPRLGGVTQSLFNHVSCAGLSACAAVGYQVNQANMQLPLAEHWNGLSWSLQRTPLPRDSEGDLHGVSCLAASWCIATGESQSNAPPYDFIPLAELYAASATPSLSTTASPGVALGGQVHDTATLSGGQSPTGYLHFKLYGPDDTSCSLPAVFATAVKISGDGTYPSPSFAPTQAGTYRFIATYSGDQNNNPVSGACGAVREHVTVS